MTKRPAHLFEQMDEPNRSDRVRIIAARYTLPGYGSSIINKTSQSEGRG